MKAEAIIGVKDVEKSSQWYQRLLNCKSGHGGPVFDILMSDEDNVLLYLHKWSSHGHPTLNNPDLTPGNGLVLYFRVNDLDQVWQNAQNLDANIEEPPHLNPNSGKQEFSLWDIDGYYLTISL